MNNGRNMRLVQPPNTCVYNVKTSDTLARIALRFNTTPSELSRLNHLSCSLLFPGQTLFVPEKKDDKLEDKANPGDCCPLKEEIVRQSDSYQGKRSMSIPMNEDTDHSLERLLDKDDLHSSPDEVSKKYLKISSKYVTDGQGVVAGILLVTPQTLMFNPNVSDHLVMDRGREIYLVHAPLKSISKVTFYEDIAAMVGEETEKQHIPSASFINYESSISPKPGVIICQGTGETYTLLQSENTKYDNYKETLTEEINILINDVDLESNKLHSQENLTKDQGIYSMSDNQFSETQINDNNTELNVNTKQIEIDQEKLFINEKPSSSTPKHAFPKENSDSVCNENGTEKKLIDNNTNLKNNIEKTNIDKTCSKVNNYNATRSPPSNSHNEFDRTSKKDPHLSKSYDLSKDSGISDSIQLSDTRDTDQRSLESHENTLPFNENTQNLHEVQQRRAVSPSSRSMLSDETRQWLGKRGISLPSGDNEDMKSDGELSPDEIIPQPARRMTDTLVYVAIKIHKSYWLPSRTRHNVIMGIPPNRDQKRRQHWFALPKERIDQFYSFLLHWAPDVTNLNSGFSTPCSEENVLEGSEEGINFTEDRFRNSPATSLGYEKLSKEDASNMHQLRSPHCTSKTSLRSLCEDEPDLLAESALLTTTQINQLSRKLPSRTVGHSWELVYSTAIHGISLTTLYRNFQCHDSPVLLLVRDEHKKLFGAFISEPPRLSDGFYGTGESMLFTFTENDKVQVYQWTGENNFFIKGSKTSLAIGGGEGVFGLWLDEDLYRGRSHSCKTFENDTLSENEDFRCTGLEAWTFL